MTNKVIKNIAAIGLLSCLFISFYFSLLTYGNGGTPQKFDQQKHIKNTLEYDSKYVLYNHGYVTPISENYYKLIKKTLILGIIIYVLFLPCLLLALIYFINEVGFDSNYIWKNLFWPMRDDSAFNIFAKLYFLLMFIVNGFLFFINKLFLSENNYVMFLLIIYIAICFFAFLITKFMQKNISAKKD